VQVSELELAAIRPGQMAAVRLDAFADRLLTGRVSRISPDADATARLIPIEVTIPNVDRRIASGLLARVRFTQSEPDRVVIPEAALQLSPNPGATGEPTSESATGRIFVVNRSGEATTAQARTVQLGDRADGSVEVLSGLKPGESFVVRSSGDLQDGIPVRLSLISESPNS